MERWDRSATISAIEALALTGNNVVLAHYWLSLWTDDRPPTRSQFDPARIKALLPGVSIVDVRENPICRLSGTAIDLACRKKLQGMNLLDFVTGDARRVRRTRLQAVVDGSVAVSRNRYQTSPISTLVVESIQLPFWGISEDGARQYIAHTNWRPDASFTADAGSAYDVGLPDEYAAIAIA